MSLITKVKLNNRQKAIGTILLFPWYLYFAPSFFNFLIKFKSFIFIYHTKKYFQSKIILNIKFLLTQNNYIDIIQS